MTTPRLNIQKSPVSNTRSKEVGSLSLVEQTLVKKYDEELEKIKSQYVNEVEILRREILGESVFLREKNAVDELNLNRVYQAKINRKYAMGVFLFFMGFLLSLLMIFIFWFFAKNNGEISTIYSDIFCENLSGDPIT